MAGAGDGIDLVDLITQGKKFGAQTAAALEEVTRLTAAGEVSGNAALTAIKDNARIEGEVIVKEAELKLQKEARAKETMAIFGSNIEASDAVIRKLIDRNQKDSEEVRASKEAFVKKMSVGITDDLFQWIGNQFTLPTDAAIHNAKVGMRDADSARITQLQQQTKEQIAIQNSADAGTTTAIAALQAQGRAALGVKEAAQWTYQMQRSGLDALQIRNVLNHNMLNMSFNMFQASNAAQSLQLAQTRETREAANDVLNRQIKDLQIKALQRDQAAIDDFTKRFNDVRGLVNVPASSWVEFQKLSKEEKDNWEKLMKNPDMANGRYAGTPAESFAIAKSLNLQIPGAGGLTAGYIEKAYDRALSNINWKQLTPEQRIKLTNDEFEKILKIEATNVPLEKSLLSLGSLGNTLNIKVLQGGIGKLFVEELAPLAKDSTYPTKPMDFIVAAEKLVAAGKMDNSVAAAQLERTFKAAQQDNAEQKQIKRFSVDGKIFETYNTVLDTGAPIGGRVPVQMTNRAAIENFLIRRQNQTRFSTGNAAFDINKIEFSPSGSE